MPKLYDELATWWPLLSPPSHYADEAASFERLFLESGIGDGARMLELGCGGGSNAFYLKKHFRMTLTDLSAGMLAISGALNPECEHIEGDMRTLRLGRLFDAVFVHDAIMYMTTREDLRKAIETAFAHCRPGGTALFAPDHVRETFQANTEHGGTDETGRAMRYLEWTYDPDENDTTVITDFAYILREGTQSVTVEHDRHITGLFPRAEWLGLLAEVGFVPRVVHDQYDRNLFVASKPIE